MSENYFVKLNGINVNDHTEKKNGLTYLSWAWAWAEVKKLYPDSTYTVYENEALGNMPYFTDGKTCFVKTGVTVNGIEHIEYLPVMDFKNKSIPADSVTSFDVNKSIQRSLTKALARHGLGLYIYAGEDLPEGEEEPKAETPKEPVKYVPKKGKAPAEPVKIEDLFKCESCGAQIVETKGKDGNTVAVDEIVRLSREKTGKTLCAGCLKRNAK